MRTFMNHSINFTNFEWNITENLYTLNQLCLFFHWRMTTLQVNIGKFT